MVKPPAFRTLQSSQDPTCFIGILPIALISPHFSLNSSFQNSHILFFLPLPYLTLPPTIFLGSRSLSYVSDFYFLKGDK